MPQEIPPVPIVLMVICLYYFERGMIRVRQKMDNNKQVEKKTKQPKQQPPPITEKILRKWVENI